MASNFRGSKKTLKCLYIFKKFVKSFKFESNFRDSKKQNISCVINKFVVYFISLLYQFVIRKQRTLVNPENQWVLVSNFIHSVFNFNYKSYFRSNKVNYFPNIKSFSFANFEMENLLKSLLEKTFTKTNSICNENIWNILHKLY